MRTDRYPTSCHIPNRPIVIVGCGGIGSQLAMALACFIEEPLYLIDDDTVEDSNLGRTPYRLADVGKKKVYALAEMLRERTNATIVPLEGKFSAFYEMLININNICIIDCTDTILPNAHIKLGANIDTASIARSGDVIDVSSILDSNARERNEVHQVGRRGYTSVHVGTSMMSALLGVMTILKENFGGFPRAVDLTNLPSDRLESVLEWKLKTSTNKVTKMTVSRNMGKLRKGLLDIMQKNNINDIELHRYVNNIK